MMYNFYLYFKHFNDIDKYDFKYNVRSYFLIKKIPRNLN